MHESSSPILFERLQEIIAEPPERGFENWWQIPEVQDAYRRAATAFVESVKPLPYPFPGDGEGIVTMGGGLKYFPSVWVLVNQLRAVGCELPIECWHMGREEMDPCMRRLLERFDVRCRDILEVRKEHPTRRLGGWQLKPFVIQHSEFQEVLFLDADNAPTRDPSYLFSQPGHAQAGAIFWPDFPKWFLEEKVFEVFGVPVPSNMNRPCNTNDMYRTFGAPIPPCGWDLPVESGQLLIDKAKCWKALALAHWYCDHSEYYFTQYDKEKRRGWVHGDKECFHMAWRRLDAPYAMPPFFPNWDKHTALQYDFAGEVIFEHRNWDKWSLDGNQFGSGSARTERPGFRHVEALRALWSGRLWDNAHPTKDEAELIAGLVGKRFVYELPEGKYRTLELAKGHKIGEGAGSLETRWSAFVEDGKPLLVLSGDSTPTAFLRQSPTGWWVGQWCKEGNPRTRLIPCLDESEVPA